MLGVGQGPDSGMTSIRNSKRPGLSGRTAGAAVIALLLFAGLASRSGHAEDPGLVTRALATELTAAQDASHPMRYRSRKSTPRLTSTKQIIETRDGAVARLLTINDAAPGAEDRQKDDARLDELLADPSHQKKRKQNQQDDTGRAVKVLRALPKAFLYQYAGSAPRGIGTIERYTFVPNPKFNPSDLELQVLTALTGELDVDPVHERVTRLEGHLQQDVDIGWGILGRLYKGGWLVISQAEVGGGQWRIVHFQMAMSARVIFKARSFDTVEDQSDFEPVPVGLTYQQAIQLLRSSTEPEAQGNPASRRNRANPGNSATAAK